MKICQQELRYLTKDAVLKLESGCCPSFQSSYQEVPLIEVSSKYIKKESRYFNKTFNFELNIGILPLIFIPVIEVS